MALPHTTFVFSPALYPQTPLINTPVFVHGLLTEVKVKPNEVILKGKDEKGEWSAYVEQYLETFTVGQRVRAYGLIVPQPDGNVMLAAKWAKIMSEDEQAYCQKQATKEWETIVAHNPTISSLVPFVSPVSKKTNATTPTPSPRPHEEPDFIPATQFKVEHDYL